jgi:hypothetical protein
MCTPPSTAEAGDASGSSSARAPQQDPSPDHVPQQLNNITQTLRALITKMYNVETNFSSYAPSAAARLDILESRIRPGNSSSQQISPDDAVEAAGEQMSEPQIDETVSLVPIQIATPPSNPPETTVLDQNSNPIPAVFSPKSLLAEAVTVYETLEDKSSATKKEMVLYVQGATLYYTNTAFCSTQEVENKLYDDFHNWNEDDFSAAKSYRVSIRDKLWILE